MVKICVQLGTRLPSLRLTPELRESVAREFGDGMNGVGWFAFLPNAISRLQTGPDVVEHRAPSDPDGEPTFADSLTFASDGRRLNVSAFLTTPYRPADVEYSLGELSVLAALVGAVAGLRPGRLLAKFAAVGE